MSVLTPSHLIPCFQYLLQIICWDCLPSLHHSVVQSHFRFSLHLTLLRSPLLQMHLTWPFTEFRPNSPVSFQRGFSEPHYMNIVLWRPPNLSQFVFFVFIFNRVKHYIPYLIIHFLSLKGNLHGVMTSYFIHEIDSDFFGKRKKKSGKTYTRMLRMWVSSLSCSHLGKQNYVLTIRRGRYDLNLD